MVQPLITRQIPADFLTANHYILGQVKVSNTGLTGLLCDVNTSYLELNDANQARIVKPDKVINYSPVMWLVKEQIVAICLNKREYVGSSSLLRGGFVRIYEYPVQITTPVYEMQGTLEWTGRFDFSIIMSDGTTSFLPLYDAVVIATLFPALHLESPVVMFNRRFIDTLATIKKGTQELA